MKRDRRGGGWLTDNDEQRANISSIQCMDALLTTAEGKEQRRTKKSKEEQHVERDQFTSHYTVPLKRKQRPCSLASGMGLSHPSASQQRQEKKIEGIGKIRREEEKREWRRRTEKQLDNWNESITTTTA